MEVQKIISLRCRRKEDGGTEDKITKIQKKKEKPERHKAAPVVYKKNGNWKNDIWMSMTVIKAPVERERLMVIN